MTIKKESHWVEGNRTYLMSAIQIVMEELAYYLSDDPKKEAYVPIKELIENFESNKRALEKPAAVDIIVKKLALSDFEKKILLICAGVELNSEYSHFIASVQSHDNLIHPSFNLLLAGLHSSHWDAISPASPLRKWNLIQLEKGPLLAKKTLRIEEGILHFLTGFSYLESQISSVIKPIENEYTLSDSQNELIKNIASDYQKKKFTTWHH